MYKIIKITRDKFKKNDEVIDLDIKFDDLDMAKNYLTILRYANQEPGTQFRIEKIEEN